MGKNIKQYMISAACLLLACEAFAGPNIYGIFAPSEENSSHKYLYIYGNGIFEFVNMPTVTYGTWRNGNQSIILNSHYPCVEIEEYARNSYADNMVVQVDLISTAYYRRILSNPPQPWASRSIFFNYNSITCVFETMSGETLTRTPDTSGKIYFSRDVNLKNVRIKYFKRETKKYALSNNPETNFYRIIFNTLRQFDDETLDIVDDDTLLLRNERGTSCDTLKRFRTFDANENFIVEDYASDRPFVKRDLQKWMKQGKSQVSALCNTCNRRQVAGTYAYEKDATIFTSIYGAQVPRIEFESVLTLSGNGSFVFRRGGKETHGRWQADSDSLTLDSGIPQMEVEEYYSREDNKNIIFDISIIQRGSNDNTRHPAKYMDFDNYETVLYCETKKGKVVKRSIGSDNRIVFDRDSLKIKRFWVCQNGFHLDKYNIVDHNTNYFVVTIDKTRQFDNERWVIVDDNTLCPLDWERDFKYNSSGQGFVMKRQLKK